MTRHDRADLARLGLCLLVIPLVWIAALGWRGDTLLGAVDQIDSTYLLLRDLQSQCRGDFTCFGYRPDLLGGVKIHDVMGTPPLFRLLGRTPLGPIGILDVTVLLTQAACAFLGLRAASDLASAWTGRPVEPSLPARIGVILVTAFAPAIGWRIATGHISNPMGVSVWIAAFALLLAARNGTLSITLLAFTALSVWNGIAWIGAIQHVVYGPFFGGLILLAALVQVRPRARLAVPVAVMLGAALIGAPALAGMIDHISGSDAGRRFGESVIYAYTTATRRDWTGSLFWGATLVPTGRPDVYAHEVNYPMGPLLLVLALVPFRRARLLALGLAAALVVPVLFSMNVPQVTGALTTIFPPLHGFRVPARAVIPFLHYLPIVASAALLRLDDRAPPGRARLLALAAAIGLALLFIPPIARELAGWSIAAIAVALAFARRALPAEVILVILGMGTLGAFRERQPPFATAEQLIHAPARAGAELRRLAPELEHPLVRVAAGWELPPFQHNPAQAAGVSSLDGYLNPPRRFLSLVAALDGVPPDYTVNSFRFAPAAASFRALQPLYNEVLRATGVPGQMTIERLGPTAGPAWFSTRIERLPDLLSVARALRDAGPALASTVRERMWLDGADPVVATLGAPAPPSPACAAAEVLGVDAARGGQSFRVRVKTEAQCPLALAMSFATNLEARAGATRLDVFPAYGALAAVMVPAGAGEVVVEAREEIPVRAYVLSGVGALLIGIALAAVARDARRRRRD